MWEDGRVDNWLVATLANGVLKTMVNDRLQVACPLLYHRYVPKVGIFGRQLLAEVLDAHMKSLSFIWSEVGRILHYHAGQGVTIIRC